MIAIALAFSSLYCKGDIEKEGNLLPSPLRRRSKSDIYKKARKKKRRSKELIPKIKNRIKSADVQGANREKANISKLVKIIIQ